jgi:hypothetical protein
MPHSTLKGTASSLTVEPHASAPPLLYFLSADAYCCEFGDGAIILDVRNDTYIGVDRQHVDYLKGCINNWPGRKYTEQAGAGTEVAATTGLISDLISRGILTTRPTSKRPDPAARPDRALSDWNSDVMRRRIPLRHIAEFALSLLAVSTALRQNGLASLLCWIGRHQSSIDRKCSVESRKLSRCVASFVWLRLWCYTAYRRCLFDSLVLSVYLTRQSIPCTISIGVATKPFLAHAWVQIDDCVLNDTAEHVQEFEPILSIGG